MCEIKSLVRSQKYCVKMETRKPRCSFNFKLEFTALVVLKYNLNVAYCFEEEVTRRKFLQHVVQNRGRQWHLDSKSDRGGCSVIGLAESNWVASSISLIVFSVFVWELHQLKESNTAPDKNISVFILKPVTWCLWASSFFALKEHLYVQVLAAWWLSRKWKSPCKPQCNGEETIYGKMVMRTGKASSCS